ncbi:hypothetical protein BDZ97DRAFT_1669447 [Flammula alnicola]|nr:hypothetical protein BDZ97DRAFT_1669447 [Flammula alnicola]
MENFESDSSDQDAPESPGPSKTFSRAERIENVLNVLRDGRLSPFDLVLDVLDESNPQFSAYRNEFYKAENRKLGQFLDLVLSSTAGKKKLNELILSHALELICEKVTTEMDVVQEAEKLPGLSAITPEFINSWTVSGHRESAPFLFQILLTAAETASAKEKNKKKTPLGTCNVIMKQLCFQRSHFSLGFAGQFGLFLWTTGCARQTIEALHRCGLSVCYTSVLKIIESLANHCIQLAIQVGRGMHMFCYDNVNFSTSIFVEQRGSLGPAKVTSGTFGVIYKVRNGNPEHMKLAPILERLKNAVGLEFNRDVRPTRAQLESFQFQLVIIIIRVLTTFSEHFESYALVPALQHKPRRPMPKGHITEQYPIRATTIDEATVRGNLLFHDDVYLTQLKRDPEHLSKYAIPTFNDQLTNSRIRSGQILRLRDLNPWTQRQVFQLGFGLFHLCLNLVWALLHIHRGGVEQASSLTYFFTLLSKARLGGEHPDYHTLLATLTQIRDGLLLNAWREECGHSNLKEFAESKPTPEQLSAIAQQILLQYATPMAKPNDDEMESSDESEGNNTDSGNSDARHIDAGSAPRPQPAQAQCPNPEDDVAYHNIRLLTRDLIYVAELVRAISDGDIGCIEDFLPQLGMMFRGAGGNNYCTEILHFIFNLLHVWTPEFADIMHDNMLVNVSGLEGHSMPIDINIEHLIGELKILLEAKGLQSTWDRLGNISAAIDYLKKVKKQVATAMSTAYQSTTHTKPDTTPLVWLIANNARDEKLQTFKKDRHGNDKVIPVLDILAVGEQKLKSSSLGTFNRKIMAMKDGHLYQPEPSEDTDTLPELALGRNLEDVDTEQ